MRFYASWGLVKRLFACLGCYAILALGCFLNAFFGGRAAVVLLPLFALNSLFLYVAILLPLRGLTQQYIRFNEGYDKTPILDRECFFMQEENMAMKKLQAQVNSQDMDTFANRQAQYLALQNQINPHFLYNTLESIRGDALCAGAQGIANVTEALATFFRYSISNMDNLVQLEDELHNAENYFIIQNYRFGDRITMEVTVEEGSAQARNYWVPKLILQPIIENAIIHGLENRVGPGKVTLHIGTDCQRLLISVMDDGAGMSAAVLDDIHKRLARVPTQRPGNEGNRTGGIALVNVDNRIKILFGEQFGLMVSSVPNLGTRVAISLPIKKDSSTRDSEA